MTCFSCIHWTRKQEGPIAWRHVCGLGLPGFPKRTNEDCLAFVYEPGSDEEETKK